MSADSLAEIEARLDELDDKEEQATELTESFNDALHALDDIDTHPLVNGETTAQVQLLKHMLREIRQHDIHVHQGVRHERDVLRRRAHELKHDEQSDQ